MINVCFYTFPKKMAVPLFGEVARRIMAAESDIRVRVARTDSLASLALAVVSSSRHPTVHVEMDRYRWIKPLRGTRLQHLRGMGKVNEYRLLEAAGVPVPEWTEITPDTRLDANHWGRYVVVKPDRGARGAFVWITRASRVAYKPPADYPDDHPGRIGPMIAQRYIHTGPRPAAYRVVTFFGEPVMAIRYENRQSGALDRDPRAESLSRGANIVASATGSTISFCFDEDVLDFARRNHRTAMPLVPSLGQDILREHDTGRLYVAEVNPAGESWMLSNISGREMQAEFALDFVAQFDAADVISRRTIEIARLHAS